MSRASACISCRFDGANQTPNWPKGHYSLRFLVQVIHEIDFESPLAPDDAWQCLDASGVDLGPLEDDVRTHLHAVPYLEVMVSLAGTDEITGNSVEARHSYLVEEKQWHRIFAPSVSLEEDGAHCVDFHQSHQTVKDDAVAQNYKQQQQV